MIQNPQLKPQNHTLERSEGSKLKTYVEGLRNRLTRRPRSALLTPHSALVDGEFLLKLDRLSLQIGKDLVAGLMGEHRATRRTAGIEFADHREYVLGDDLRRVDWNAYARLGTLHIRQSQAEHDTTLYLMLDSSPSMEYGYPSKYFTARRLAAALGYVALAHLDRVVMTTPGASQMGATSYELRATSTYPQPSERSDARSPQPTQNWSGKAESPLLFHHLQDLRVGGVAEFGGTLTDWSTRRGQGRAALLISDLLTDGYQEGVRQLVGAGFAVTVLHLLSPEELAPPTIGDVELIDSETGREIELNLGPESLAEYHRRLDRWLGETRAWAAANGANYLLIGSDWDIERTMLETLRIRGVTI